MAAQGKQRILPKEAQKEHTLGVKKDEIFELKKINETAYSLSFVLLYDEKWPDTSFHGPGTWRCYFFN